MITIISLGNIITTYSYNFFLVMRTFKIYSLSNFQIYNAYSVKYSHHVLACFSIMKQQDGLALYPADFLINKFSETL